MTKFYFRKHILEEKMLEKDIFLSEGFVVAKDYNILGGKMFTYFDNWRDYTSYVENIPYDKMFFYEGYVNGMNLKINFDIDFSDVSNITRENVLEVIDDIKSIIGVEDDKQFIVDRSSRYGYHLAWNEKHFEGENAWLRMRNYVIKVKDMVFEDLGNISEIIDLKPYKSFYLMKMRGNRKMGDDISDIKRYEKGDREFWKSLITVVGSKSKNISHLT